MHSLKNNVIDREVKCYYPSSLLVYTVRIESKGLENASYFDAEELELFTTRPVYIFSREKKSHFRLNSLMKTVKKKYKNQVRMFYI